MADKRISDLPAATQWHPDAFIPQDNPAGLTEKVTPAQVETKLEADGFIKAASPSLGQVAAYTAGGWAPIKLADANIDAAAAIGWGKISKTGAVASDVGALPAVDPIITGTPKIDNGSGNLSRMRFNAGANRWTLGISSSSEGGDDTGSPFTLAAYTDAGELIDTPIFFERKASSPITVFRSLVLLPLVGTGTRPAAIDSTGKLVVGSANIRTFGTASASFTYSASTPSVVRTTGAIYVTLPAAADFSGSETVFFQEYVGGNSLGFTGQTFESSVSSGSWVTHTSGYGWSVAWRKIILSCDGITWYVVVQ